MWGGGGDYISIWWEKEGPIPPGREGRKRKEGSLLSTGMGEACELRFLSCCCPSVKTDTGWRQFVQVICELLPQGLWPLPTLPPLIFYLT